MPQPWRTLRSDIVFQESWFILRRDAAQLPDGRVADPYFRIELPHDWVNLLAITRDGQALLTRQYRHAAGVVCLETIGGGMETGETPEQAALRELREETGYSSPRVSLLASLYPNPALQNNRMHVLLLQDCEQVGDQQLDPTEDIEVVMMPLHALRPALLRGEFPQALHCACLCFALARLGL